MKLSCLHSSIFMIMARCLAAQATENIKGYVYVIPLNSRYDEFPMPTSIPLITLQESKILFSHMLRTYQFLSHDIGTHFGKYPVWLHPSIRGNVRENVGVNLLMSIQGVDSPTDILPSYVPAFHLKEHVSVSSWRNFTDQLVQDVWDRYGGSWRTNYDNAHGGKMDSVVEYSVTNRLLPYPSPISKTFRIFNRVYSDLNSSLFSAEIKEDAIFVEEMEYIARTVNSYSWSVYNLSRLGPDFLNFNVGGLELIRVRHGCKSAQYAAAKNILRRLLKWTVISYIQSTYSYRNTVAIVLKSPKKFCSPKNRTSPNNMDFMNESIEEPFLAIQ
ncbi:hypothetical protein K7432_004255 [Basidiobolus ranarum]|uniref:Vacuolar sorting protein Vps3844 N-terminal domain-containing protein n=1 Tax=Basidiobolus ranarum TaxID=34480 RepID=A0ABR2W4W3_9FUNG